MKFTKAFDCRLTNFRIETSISLVNERNSRVPATSFTSTAIPSACAMLSASWEGVRRGLLCDGCCGRKVLDGSLAMSCGRGAGEGAGLRKDAVELDGKATR